MTKEYEINDILGAIDGISKIKRKKVIAIDKNDDLTMNNQEKSSKSEILVLDEMIE
tara:strand:- start:727 stop:894 length:168 start_codon:yes stop_codon:yes gene_type:complete